MLFRPVESAILASALMHSAFTDTGAKSAHSTLAKFMGSGAMNSLVHHRLSLGGVSSERITNPKGPVRQLSSNDAPEEGRLAHDGRRRPKRIAIMIGLLATRVSGANFKG